jgi:hypothetical protein
MDNASSLVRGHQPHLLSGFHCTSHCTPRSGLRHLGVRDQRLMSGRCVHRFKPGNRTAPLRQSRRIDASDEGLSGAHPSPRQAEVSEADLVDRVGRLGEGELLAVRTRQLVDKSLAGRIVIGVGDPSAMSAKPFTAHGFTLRPIDDLKHPLRDTGFGEPRVERVGNGERAFHLLVVDRAVDR